MGVWNEMSTFLIMRTFITLSRRGGWRLIHFLNTWSVLCLEPSAMSDGHITGVMTILFLQYAEGSGNACLNQLRLSMSTMMLTNSNHWNTFSLPITYVIQTIHTLSITTPPPLCMHWLIASHTNNFTGWPEWILLDYISHFWEATICAGEVFHKHMSAVTHKCNNAGEVRRKRVTRGGREPKKKSNQICKT